MKCKWCGNEMKTNGAGYFHCQCDINTTTTCEQFSGYPLWKLKQSYSGLEIENLIAIKEKKSCSSNMTDIIRNNYNLNCQNTLLNEYLEKANIEIDNLQKTISNLTIERDNALQSYNHLIETTTAALERKNSMIEELKQTYKKR